MHGRRSNPGPLSRGCLIFKKSGPGLWALLVLLAALLGPPSPLRADPGPQPAELSEAGIRQPTAPANKTGPEGGLSIRNVCYLQADSGQPPRFGNVYALFLDKWGQLREDSNANLTLDQSPGSAAPDGGSPAGDRLIRFIKAEDNSLVLERGRDESGRNEVFNWAVLGPEEKINTLWNTGELLSAFDDRQLLEARPYLEPILRTESALSGGRRIYTFLDKDQAPDEPITKPGKPVLFAPQSEAALRALIFKKPPPASPSSLPGPDGDPEAAFRLISYVLGQDQNGWPGRAVKSSLFPGERIWRLGSAGESKPLMVGAPAARHHLLYGDRSYLEFKKKMAGRRQMVYFGTNDGLFHAVNSGFYRPLEKTGTYYSRTGPVSAPDHELGAEIWGFISPGLLPRLPKLADPSGESGLKINYLKPVAADIKTDGRWKTILIGGLRLESGPASGKSEPAAGHSEFFAFDVTDPENEPELLWIFRHKDLGLAQVPPAIVANEGRWHVLIANGPPAGGGGRGRIFVLEASGGHIERILDDGQPGIFFTAPFCPVAPDYLVKDKGGENPAWSSPAVYFGQAGLDASGRPGGGVYRVQMTDEGSETAGPKALKVSDWQLKPLLKTPGPVTGAVNSALDINGNRWVFFAGGSLGLKNGRKQYLYGLKEPLNEKGYLSFEEVKEEGLVDLSGIRVFESGAMNSCPGGPGAYEKLSQSLLRIEPNPGYTGYKRDLSDLNEAEGSSPAVGLSQPKLEPIGNGRSLLVFSSYEPSSAGPSPELGRSRLMVVDAFTGLPAPYMKPLSGWMEAGEKLEAGASEISGYLNAGPGRAGESFIIKTDRGTAMKCIGFNGAEYSVFIDRDHSLNSGLVSWREVSGMDFSISEEELAAGLSGLDNPE